MRTAMKDLEKVIVVGANLAGARVAEALRTRGFVGQITLIGSEAYLPYERPPLSKQFLMDGEVTVDRLMIRSPQQWDDIDVQIQTAETVTGVDASTSTVSTAAGKLYRDVDAVVLCTGGRNRRLEVPGVDLAGVQYLRDLNDAASLAIFLRNGGRVVIVGGGYIGLEVAASASILGCAVTVVETAPSVLSRALPARWSAVIAAEHRRRGVEIHTGTSVRRFIGNGRVRGVELDDGTVLDADVVVIGVGMEPAVELAESTALETRGGIVVDAGGRTSNPRIFASGDVTVQPDLWGGRGLRRFESFQSAQEQSDAVAAAILGQPLPKRPVPWFWSDQYELNIQTAGDTSSDKSEVVVRGVPEDQSFVAFHVRNSRMVGVFGLNSGREVRAAMKLIDSGTQVQSALLSDPSVDLRHLPIGPSVDDVVAHPL